MSRPHLHVVNGDAALSQLRKAAVPGESVSFPDMLMEGPLNLREGRLDGSSRAGFLAEAYGVPRKAAADRIRTFNRALDLAARGNVEVTFWFEEDAFCQVNLLYLLANLPEGLRKPGRATLICPVRPLGLRTPGGLERLFARRKAVSKERIVLARKAWAAAAASPPRARIGRLLEDGEAFAAWPRLRKGLRAWIAARDGGLERALLSVLRASTAPVPFSEAFRKAAAHPGIRLLGLGDAQVARLALDLASRPEPPLRIMGRTAAASGPLSCGKWTLVATR